MVTRAESPEKQLDGFLAKYLPEIAAQARAVRAKMRKRLPGAIEMVYDNYNWLVIGYSPNERPSDAIFSIAIAPRWVTFCFLQGAGLPDPDKLLKGSGRIVRHVRLESPKDLDRPAMQALIAAALEDARAPINNKSPRRLMIKSISAKQRPRRPPKT
jgi:hypothetical protein